jgi:predicted HicB family RNase H-like nuclease
MEYRGYVAKIEFDESVGRLHGRVLDTRDVISFDAESVGELRDAFREAVNDYLAFCAERGESPDRPFSGRILLRATPELHRQVTAAAAQGGKSVNEWVTDVLSAATETVR